MIDLIIRREVLSKLEGVKPSGGGYMARCPLPGHEDRVGSLSINPGQTQPVVMWCHPCKVGGREIAEAAGINWELISKPADQNSATALVQADTWMPCKHNKVDEYAYQWPDRRLAFAVARCDHKGIDCQGFRQWRPDSTSRSGKKWSRTLPDGTKVGEGLPYRLPDLIGSKESVGLVYITEGEKDVNRLWGEFSMPATCNAEGAGKWTPQHAEWLNGYDVIVVADRDEPGRKHALHVVDTLMPHARSIEIAQAAHGKDASDHLDAGGTLGDLIMVARPKERDWQYIGRNL